MSINPLLETARRNGWSRRIFLRNLFFSAGSVTTASYLTACQGAGRASPTQSPPDTGSPVLPGIDSPFKSMGPLLEPDENGIRLPAGFSSRLLATIGQPPISGDSSFTWHSDPDGGGTFATDDGGWIYVSNSEARDLTTIRDQDPSGIFRAGLSREAAGLQGATFGGGVSALRFDAGGNLVDAYACQRGTTTNCSGGATPWGTWINGEEIWDGYMWECSPLRDGGEPRRLDRFGRKAHEMVAIDEQRRAIYHTEDIDSSTDRFYRNVWQAVDWPQGGRPDMDAGKLQVLYVPDGIEAARQGPVPIVWNDAIDDGRPQPATVDEVEATVFAGNEGVWYLNGFIYFSTKSDDNIWVIDVDGNTIESIYDPARGVPGSPFDEAEMPMTGVDNIFMTDDGEMLVVEDGGFMRCMVLLPDGSTVPLLQLPGNAELTEVTGVSMGPTGDRVYVSGQRSLPLGAVPIIGGEAASPIPTRVAGVTYEIQLPFQVNVTRPLARAL